MPDPYRVGVYYAPAEHDPLWQTGCAWLGRDAATGFSLPQPDLPGLAEQTADARRYGLHATLKAPFVPRHGFEKFMQAAADFAAKQKKFPLPTLAVTQLHGFLALCPIEPKTRLNQLADDCVIALDDHRQPESTAMQAQRGVGKTDRQIANIARFGYPFIFEDFTFHMTLTGQIQNNPYFAAACDHFSSALAETRQVESLAIFLEDEKGAAFRLFCHLPFAA